MSLTPVDLAEPGGMSSFPEKLRELLWFARLPVFVTSSFWGQDSLLTLNLLSEADFVNAHTLA